MNATDEDYPQLDPLDPRFPEPDEWSAFISRTIYEDRFGRSDESTALIEKIRRACRKNWSKVIPQGQTFYRCRTHPLDRPTVVNKLREVAGLEPLTDGEICAPQINRATAGRANPTGIPYLYLSDKAATAIAEARPWLTAMLTVCAFEIKRDLTIADLCPTPEEKQSAVRVPGVKEDSAKPTKAKSLRWAIGKSFARPLHRDHETGYAPTQLVAESIKTIGFDGIAFPSAMRNKGWNLALFLPDDAKPGQRRVMTIDKIEYFPRDLGTYSPSSPKT